METSTNEIESAHNHHHESDIELVGAETVPFNQRVPSRRFGSKSNSVMPHDQEDDDDDIDQVMDIQGDPVVAIGSNDGDLLSKGMKKKTSFMKQVTKLKQLTSFAKPEKVKRDRTHNKSSAFHALKEFKFITKAGGDDGWKKVEDEFDNLTKSTKGLLNRSLFAKCIGMKAGSETFACELFDAISRRKNIHKDSINKTELKDFWDQICNPSFDSRLRTFFDMVDKDADGRITQEEIKEIISLSANTNKLSTIQNHAEEYAALIMEELDPKETGFITAEQLEMLLFHEPTHSSKHLMSKLLSIKPKVENKENRVKKWFRDTNYFLQDNWQRTLMLVLWIGVMCGLFAYKFVQYRRKAAYEVMGHCVCMAKGAAETLKLNMAIILLPVCRNTVTWLRSKTKLGIVVPFNDNLNFHKVIAVAIAIGVGIHAIYHLACDFPSLINANSEKYKLMEPYFGKQPSNYWHFVKSWEGVTGIIMVVLMTIAFILATPWFRRGTVKLFLKSKGKNEIKLPKLLNSLIGFNAFWYSHHLFVFVYALLIVHGIKLYFVKEWYKKTTWMYLSIPIIIYALERLTRILRSHIKSVELLKVVVYPGDVLALRMSKPKGFRYKSGQYMFVNCATVSPFQWHPFSITSAPEDNYIGVHIKELGDWTKSLRLEFEKSCRPPTEGQSGVLRAECLPGENSSSSFPKVLIDGPYGAPAQDYKQYEVVLLVGLGIGGTPMISIIKDILNNVKAIEEEEGNNIEEGKSGNLQQRQQKKTGLKSKFKTRKAYFYWVTGEQGFFDWFKGVMNEVAEEDHNQVIEIHNHLTSIYEDGDARSALIALIQSLNLAKKGVDVVTGTPVKAHFARPNWRNIYKGIARNHPQNRVGVFYCGNTTPIKELRDLASEFSHKTSTKFDFHKENF